MCVMQLGVTGQAKRRGVIYLEVFIFRAIADFAIQKTLQSFQ
jgi:hypothetical protein